MADFNGDGIPDFATANVVSNNVSVFLGKGDGTFAPAKNFAVLGTNPKSVVAGDLDGDGKVDLVTCNDLSGNVSVLIGNGDGTFQTAVTYPAGAGVRDLALADLKGDGIPDIVTANGDAFNISILFGKGDGTFQSPVNYPTAGSPRSIAVMDYNGDGIPDLAVSAYNASVVNVLLGNGDGTFVSGRTIKTGPQPTSVRAADFNRDGKPDLVVTIGGRTILQNYVTILLNTPLSLSPTSLTFPSQTVGTTSAYQSVTLTNIGNVPLNLNGFSFTGADPGDFSEETNCGTSLAVAARCTVRVTFSPSVTGSRSASLSLSDAAPASPQIVTVQGTGS